MHLFRRLSQKLFLIREVTKLGADAASRRALRWRGLWLLLNDRRKVRSGFWAVLHHKGQDFDFWFEDFGDYGTLWTRVLPTNSGKWYGTSTAKRTQANVLRSKEGMGVCFQAATTAPHHT